ncbi:MAG TPA: hypothetical protein VFD30_09545, partial [Terriglobia bacterium]|nr:hypothetical protein [Terriglobia bacterium]
TGPRLIPGGKYVLHVLWFVEPRRCATLLRVWLVVDDASAPGTPRFSAILGGWYGPGCRTWDCFFALGRIQRAAVRRRADGRRFSRRRAR